MSKVQRIALLSNPEGPASLAELPRIRAFCAERPQIFHYEIEDAGQVAEAIRSIVRIQPTLLAINGGKSTVAAAIAELARLESQLPVVKQVSGVKVESLRQLVDRAA